MVNQELTASSGFSNAFRDKGFDRGNRSHYIAHHGHS